MKQDSYVHRIGRTARAGSTGISLSFCDHEERAYLRDIERLIRHVKSLYLDDHPFHLEGMQPADYADPDDDDDDDDRQKRRPNRGRRPNKGARKGSPHKREQKKEGVNNKGPNSFAQSRRPKS